MQPTSDTCRAATTRRHFFRPACGRAPANLQRQPESTFDRLLVHLVAETAQHAGHLDILREGIDGQGDAWDEVRPERDEAWWSRLWAEIAAAAEGYRNAGATVEVPEAARV